MSNSNILKIPKTLETICRCWAEAENALQYDIRNYCPDIYEEDITQIFYLNFAKTLKIASINHEIEQSFLKDLKSSFTNIRTTKLNETANGLVADLTLHKSKHTEGITGGDFGFMITRPQIAFKNSELVPDYYNRGILCQAKLKAASGKWGDFTKSQEKILPKRLSYLGLLLYSYNDSKRHNLDTFKWLLGDKTSLSILKEGLKKDDLPNCIDSAKLIKGIGTATIGTDDNNIVHEIISPKGSPSLVLNIHWPDKDINDPKSSVKVYSKQKVKPIATARVYCN